MLQRLSPSQGWFVIPERYSQRSRRLPVVARRTVIWVDVVTNSMNFRAFLCDFAYFGPFCAEFALFVRESSRIPQVFATVAGGIRSAGF
jgi:hypothetical protein